MLSPDPVLQSPGNLQNYNRYSYAMNNPLKYTDPTGYTFDDPSASHGDIQWEGTFTYVEMRGHVATRFNNTGIMGQLDITRTSVSIDDETTATNTSVDLGKGYVIDGTVITKKDKDKKKEKEDEDNREDEEDEEDEEDGSTGGGITFGEADGNYKWGNGQPLYVDLDKLDFGDVSMSRFDNPEFSIEGHPGVYVRFETSDYVNSNQALVYGTIGIVKIGDNTIMAMPDTYNFDLKLQKGTFMRDVATLWGKHYAGYGTPFQIYFRGTTTLP
jgi:hypothetical protein